MHSDNCFLTLTYDDAHIPERSNLSYRDFQLFLKRMRKGRPEFKFYMCGEYGSENGRPHFHACIFGYDFPDKTYWRKSASGAKCYRSAQLERLWPYGHCEIGEVTFESAAYVARYIMDKRNGDQAADHYMRVDPDTGEVYWLQPEFTQMSRRGGIGLSFFNRYFSDIYPHDYVVVNGAKVKPPKFYDRKLKRWIKEQELGFDVPPVDPWMFSDIQCQREADAALQASDNSPRRMADKLVCAKARVAFKKRSI